MTEEELTAIEARAAAATVGPWRHDTDGGAIGAVEAGGMALAQVQQRVPRDNARRDLDAAFIAAARADVPALVAEVRRLRTEVAKVTVAEKLVVNAAVALVDSLDHYESHSITDVADVRVNDDLENLRVAVAHLLAVEAAS